MTIAENLLDNLIVFFVLGALFVIFYCKIKQKTIGDLIKDIKDSTKNE